MPGVLLRVLLLFVPSPEVWFDANVPWSLRVAAFICGVSGFVAVFIAWLHSVGRGLSGLYTQHLRRDHDLLYGNGPLLDILVPALRGCARTPVPIRPGMAGTPDPGRTPDRLGGAEDLVRHAGLNRARSVVVDCGDDALTLSLARPILAHLRNTPRPRVRDVAVAVSDPVISDQLFEIVRRYGLATRHRIVAFDTNTALARGALADDPLFPRALAFRQSRVHALIVGFGALGERLLDQVMLTSLAGDLDTPRITVRSAPKGMRPVAGVLAYAILGHHAGLSAVVLELRCWSWSPMT